MKEQEITQENQLEPKQNNRTDTYTISRLMKLFGNMVFGIMLLAFVFLLLSLAYIKFSGGPPAVAGYQMYIVLSGSMNPAFDTGSMIFVKPTNPHEVKEGEIITFRGLGGGEQLVSHRVVTVNKTGDSITFTTKGDANDVADPNQVPGQNLVGKVALAIPYLGYFMNFAQTKQGIITLVLIPASIMLVLESYNLYKSSVVLKKENAVQCESQRDDA